MTAKRKFGWGAALLLLLAACFVYYLVTGMRSAGTISYAQLRQLFQDEKVQEFAISNTRLTAKLQDGSTVSCDLYDFQVFYNDLNDLVVQQNQQGIIKDYTYHADHSTNWLQILLPYVAGDSGIHPADESDGPDDRGRPRRGPGPDVTLRRRPDPGRASGQQGFLP